MSLWFIGDISIVNGIITVGANKSNNYGFFVGDISIVFMGFVDPFRTWGSTTLCDGNKHSNVWTYHLPVMGNTLRLTSKTI